MTTPMLIPIKTDVLKGVCNIKSAALKDPTNEDLKTYSVIIASWVDHILRWALDELNDNKKACHS